MVPVVKDYRRDEIPGRENFMYYDMEESGE